MTQPTIQPQTVTKPIQLLAAWLVGLILVDSAFLTAAAHVAAPEWAAGALVGAAIINVPLFLLFLFLMQTKFRPEMQEDTYYARYLELKSVETRQIDYVRVQPGIAEPKEVPSISVKSNRKRKKHTGKVKINDLLPDFQRIVKDFSERGIAIDGTFGSTSIGQNVPNPFIVSMDMNADPETFQEVIRSVEPFGLKAVGLTTGGFDEDYIYVGSYLYESYGEQLTNFDGRVRDDLLQKELSSDQLKKLISIIELEIVPLDDE